MLAGPKPRIFTFFSATSIAEKSAMLVNLSASLSAAGNHVVLLDACTSANGIVNRIDDDANIRATLLDVARQQRALNQVARKMPQGFALASLTRGSVRSSAQCDADQVRRLGNTLALLASQTDVLIVDAEVDDSDHFSAAIIANSVTNSEIVVQVAAGAASIKHAYALIKRLNECLGRRPFGILVSGSDEQAAQKIYQNLAKTARRYLALQLHYVGAIPADEYTTRAARLGRAVTDAFPLAAASVAFRNLAQHFSLATGSPALMSNRAELGA
jgi:flagellar biosynthesis protein FlhG